MSDRSSTGELHDARRSQAAGPAEDGTPLAQFAWSDDVVGMGYFPAELGLPSGRGGEAGAVRS